MFNDFMPMTLSSIKEDAISMRLGCRGPSCASFCICWFHHTEMVKMFQSPSGIINKIDSCPADVQAWSIITFSWYIKSTVRSYFLLKKYRIYAWSSLLYNMDFGVFVYLVAYKLQFSTFVESPKK